MDHYVFISYSSKNIEMANAVCHYLEEKNIRCWMAPRNIETGTNFAAAIIEGIKHCHYLLLLFTEDSNQSEQVLREVDRAVHFEKNILVLKTFNGNYSDALDYYLCKSESIEATRGKIEQYFLELERHLTSSCHPPDSLEIEKPIEVSPDQRIPKYESESLAKAESKIIKKLIVALIGIILLTILSSFFIYRVNKNVSSQPRELIQIAKNIESEKFKNHFVLPSDLYKQAKDHLLDQGILARLSYEDLTRLSNQIRGQEGEFLKNTRSGINEIALTDMALNNLDLIDHFMNVLINRNLPKQAWPMICLNIGHSEKINESEFRILKELENILIKHFATPAQKLYKTKIQEKPDECQVGEFISIEIDSRNFVDDEIEIKLFGTIDHSLKDKVEIVEGKKVKIEFIDKGQSNSRMLIIFSNEDGVTSVVKRYLALLWRS